ncbi:hypothetical protein FRC12_001369 [Ceratobasidium sp. 428]|nr:hypothetical protein FRC09_015795 [Ceratobasidium sp. 395]KAG8775612.1 hypothetical protein FRC12_001369 [Ceratobasidium sp. 428]
MANASTNDSSSTHAQHFVAFFAQFEDFSYDPSQSVAGEFKRLQKTTEWKKGINRGEALVNYKLALVLQFNETYGTNQNDLASWQNLCRALGVDDVPDTLSACKKIVKGTHVNLVDLVDMPNTKQPAQHFEDVAALRKYSKKNKKIFPRDEAKAGGILRHLLRPILGGYN